MEKTILLVGQTGHGKSSFINCIAGLSNSDIQLAKESDYYSCTDDIYLFKISNSLIGPLSIFDTQGLNDTGKSLSDREILYKILTHFYKSDKSFDIDAILYLTNSEDGRFHYEKNMELFSRIFNDKLDSISKSVIFVFTKFDDVKEKNIQKLEDFIKKISQDYSRPAIKWDSKYPLKNTYNQFNELGQALKSCKKYSFNFSYFQNEISKIANDLRESEKEVIDPYERKAHKIKDNKTIFTHTEHTSHAGVVVGFSFGITLLFNLTHNEKFFLHPPYPEKCENRRIDNIRYEVTRNYQVKKFNFRSELSDSKDYANIYSEIEFPVCIFGQANIEYTVMYDYSYDTVVPNENPSYRYKPLEFYSNKAKDMFFANKMESLRNTN